MQKRECEARNIADWLNDALSAAGMSQAELARQLTRRLSYHLDRSTISKIKHNQRKVTADEMVACLEILGTKVPPPWASTQLSGSVPAQSQSAPGWNSQPEAEAFREQADEFWMDAADAQSRVRLYAADVSNADMAPRYRLGERIWVDPAKSVKAGDDVYIEHIDPRTKRLAGGMIRQFVAWEGDELVVAFCTPERQERYPRESIIFVHPIVFCSRS